MKLPRKAIVEWDDAFVDASQPQPLSEICYKPTRRVTIGWLVYDEKDAVGLAQTYDTDERIPGNASTEEVAFQDVMWIPRGCVRKRTFIP